ncbi:MAG: carbohydrate-binding protein [Pedobacter sp.]|nr:MAG: carbohydrate-binding protein [Pedobacter sp.]
MKLIPRILLAFTLLSICTALCPNGSYAQNKTLSELQQGFVDLRFGMFIHYNIPTYQNEDWADPEASAAIFDPKKLDCDQWAKAAKSANMTYGCLTTKHHSGFAIWNTKTTEYSVMSSPLKRDVVKEFTDAFRANGLKVMLYYSILDTHHKLRPNSITPAHIKMVKAQLTELLTNYGEIGAIIIDGWDAPWSRISYDEIPFEEIYTLIKSLQPNCLVMDLNAAKYPAEALFYTDIKSYEQNAGQHISKESNRLPAMSCLPLNNSWFWKSSFPNEPVRNPSSMVNDNIIPLNDALCNFMLNVAPNRDGLLDDNALAALKEIGNTWSNKGPVAKLPAYDSPIISTNLVKKRPSNSSWGYDSNIMDFANDDNFGSSWISNPVVKQPWLEVSLDKEKSFNTIVVTENKPNIKKYRLEYYQKGVWKPILSGENSSRVKVHRFATVQGSKVRITIDESDRTASLAEFGVYQEKR